MSTVIQCDVCKAIIPKNNNKMMRVQTYEGNKLSQQYFDVCSECWKRFTNFKKEKNEIA